MPYPVKGLLEFYEDMVEVLLMLQVVYAGDPEIEYLFCGAPSGTETACSSAMISSACGWSLFRMIFKMTLLGWLITRDLVHVVGHSPVFQILLQIEVRMSIMASPPAWTNSVGMLSTPADFPIFSALTAASTSSRRIR